MRIGLGTVQFGMPYGVANRDGQVPEDEVRRVLAAARAAGVETLDTARAYGESEAVLGRCLPPEGFRVVTKIRPLKDAVITEERAAEAERGLGESLVALRRPRVDALLVHHAGDLLVPGGERLFERMRELKAKGLAAKIGASVYGAEEIDGLLARYPLDVVQLPVSVLDQRLVASGHLKALKKAGVEVHARSVFLQGLALADPAALPRGLEAAAPHVRRCRDAFAALGLTPLEGALSFALGRPELDVVLVGVDGEAHLRQVLAAAAAAKTADFSALAVDDARLLNPALWARG